MTFTARTETYVDFVSLTSPYDITVGKPIGTVDGDILFCWIAWRTTSAISIDSVPAGWNFLGQNTDWTDKYALYYKIASGEGASWVWSLSGTTKVRAVCSCYTAGDFDGSNPILYVSNTGYRTSDNICRAGTIYIPEVNTPIVFWAGCYSTASKTFTPPSNPAGFNEDDDAGSTTSDLWAEVCSMIKAEAGNTGDMDAIISAVLTAKHAFAVALNPLGGYPGPTPAAFNALEYATEPSSAGWNKIAYLSEPPVPSAWNKLKYKP